MKSRFLVACCSASLVALTHSAAFAQSKPVATEAEPAQTDPSAQADQAAPAEKAEDIVVTGTRIGRAGYEAPTPLTTVQTENLSRVAPASIAQGLNQLPQFQNSVSAGQRTQAQGNIQNTGNYLNMRALGPARVLVLQDGQRLAPSGNNGAVDVSLIPELLIDRVDVVTGGASAVYGSDAVSGVVNFILNKRMEGLRGVAQVGRATGGYGNTYRIGAAGGIALLDDRLHIVASAERHYSAPLYRRDLPVFGESHYLDGTGTAASPFRGIEGVRANAASLGGLINTGPLAGQQFASNGSLVPFNVGTLARNGGISIGGDGALYTVNGTATAAQQSNQVFVRPEFDFGSDIVGFFSVGYNTSKYVSFPGPHFRRVTRIYADNAYLTPAVRAGLGSTPFFDIGRLFHEDSSPDLTITQTSKSFLFNAGLNGSFGKNFKWDIGYTHHYTYFTSQQRDVQTERYYAAVDAVRDPSGNIVCRASLTNPGLYPGCVPLNPMGVGNVTQAAWDYVLSPSRWTAANTMDDVEATLSGDLFELPAGTVSFAVGGEYRRQSLDQQSNANPATPPSFTGLRGVVPQFLLKYAVLNFGVGKGDVTVKEGFGELIVPVLKDSAIGSLEFNGAARVTDYSTSGSVTTWKIGGLFDPIDGIRFRGTFSRDIRAPTLFELFAGQQTLSTPFSDPLTGQNVVAQQISGGNANLTPEIAKTFTGGVVLRPKFLSGFSFSADYYKIKIDNAIATPFNFAQTIALCTASNYTAAVCNNIVRPLGPTNPSPANSATAVFTTTENLASQTASGIDFESSYNFALGAGRVNIRALATRTITFDQTNAPGQPVRHLAGNADFNFQNVNVPLPKWRGLLTVGYINGDLSMGVQERFIGSFYRSNPTPGAAGALVYEQNSVPAILYTDINASYTLSDVPGKPELFGVVNNLFNQKPPLTPIATTPGLLPPYYVNTYDILGTYVTLGLRFKF